jgi:hypothetical protein
MLATRRNVRRSRRRAIPVRPCRSVYVGLAVSRRAASRVFLPRTTQQVTSGGLLRDCLGAAAMLGGVAGWWMLLVLLGA